jgi:ParB family chromosome partitioning protein
VPVAPGAGGLLRRGIVQPRPKVRETRTALVEHFATKHFVHPSGRFAPPADELLDWIRAGSATDVVGAGSPTTAG